MTDRITLRPAEPQDFAFCKRLYFESMGCFIAALNIDMARQHESFMGQWEQAHVRVDDSRRPGHESPDLFSSSVKVVAGARFELTTFRL